MAFYVYILTNKRRGTLYTGVTNDLIRRVYEHKEKAVPGFTQIHNLTKLVYFEILEDALTAITREKLIKKWRREIKYEAIEKLNPHWSDLYPSLCR